MKLNVICGALKQTVCSPAFVFSALCWLAHPTPAFAENPPAVQVVADKGSPLVRLAASEVRRYGYLRTGQDWTIVEKTPGTGQMIVLELDKTLAPEAYRLQTASRGGQTVQRILGGSDVGVLYGAYRYAEKLGVRFYLHGDVLPDERLNTLPSVNETGTPLFELRGIQPFHDFPEGPDWWNQDDYLAYVAQLAKLRMNFIGLHCYPEGGVGPEPLVWIGTTNALGANGTVRSGYPSQWAHTERPGMWGYAAMKTGEFCGGASLLFPTDAYGPDVMSGLLASPNAPEACNELFNRAGKQMRAVFGEAKALGVKTCIGTETPLTIPKAVRERSDVRALYTGLFTRIAEVMPVDYYWLWTPEDWTWGGNKPGQFEATTRDIQAALDALNALGNPFTLATSGWVLGPAHDRAALDEFLPKTSPMSCINRSVGHDGVEPAFANITGRPKWAIPWMENDPNMVGPQPWVARMRHDAADARRYGCTGLLGIHWRTKALEMNVAALAAAAWDQSWLPSGCDTRLVKPIKAGEGALGGRVAGFKDPVAGAAVQAVHRSVRYNLDGYALNIPDGVYTVTLQFNEPHYAEAGKRVFGAALQGRPVLEHLDLFAKVGRNTAFDVRCPEIAVTNGMLRIEFTREVEFPCIAGIVIAGNTRAGNQLAGEPFTRKINCGGAKIADYEADRVGGGTLQPSPKNRAMPVEDFYADYAAANFGSSEVGRILARMDGVAMPQVSDWKNGPGGLVPNPAPWSEVKKRVAFVDELEALRPRLRGAGNLDRFDYWLNTYRGAAAMMEVSCLRGQLDALMAAKKHDAALAARIGLAKAWTRLLALQTALAVTPGELGTIANLEQHTRRHLNFIEAHDAALAKALGKPLPPETRPGTAYTGPARLVVPTVRGMVRQGETLKLTVIVLDTERPKTAALRFRAMGRGDWQVVPLTPVGRAVYSAALPNVRETVEYHITAETVSGQQLLWPATAPQLNQTVVTME